MSERGSFRGGGHGGRGSRGGGGGDRRGGGSTRGGARHQGGDRHGGGDRDQQEKPKKENILDLTKYMDKEVIVKFNGGREGLFSSI
jgi:U6 snRNA-associated Sm-like protein LSm7